MKKVDIAEFIASHLMKFENEFVTHDWGKIAEKEFGPYEEEYSEYNLIDPKWDIEKDTLKLREGDSIINSVEIQTIFDHIDESQLNLERYKVDRCKKHWIDGGIMSLSNISLRKNGKIRFGNGRHRLMASMELGNRFAPVIVTENYCDLNKLLTSEKKRDTIDMAYTQFRP